MRVVANILKILLVTTLLSLGCESKNQVNTDVVEGQDSSTHVPFLKDGKLVVLMSNNLSSYYILKGQPRGFEYEMLKLFCKENNLELQVKVIREFEFLLDSLIAGKGDLAAGNITVTGERRARVDFSPEVLRTRQVLVQRLPENYKKLSKKQRQARLVQDALELSGKTVYVNSGSSFLDRLKNFKEENGVDVTIEAVQGETGTDELIRMLAEGEIDFTVVDENVARIHSSIYPNLDFSVPLSLSQSIAWAIPKGQTALKKMLDNWILERKHSTRYNIIYNKYFGSKAQLRQRENYLAVMGGEISPYDDLIKQYAEYIEWDWLMLAALINKESKFNPTVESPFGAVGLMQVLPTTAERFGVEEEFLHNPELNLKAGTRFLQWLDQYWYKRLEDTTQLQYFVLASYNVGPGHVLDAMRLAEKYGLDPHIWKDNVEVMLLNKSQPKYYRDPVVKSGYCNGIQPVVYVNKIMDYYAYYRAFAKVDNGENAMAAN